MRKRLIIIGTVTVIGLIAGVSLWLQGGIDPQDRQGTSSETEEQSSQQPETAESEDESEPNATTPSTNDPSSTAVLVNKSNPLPSDYVPANLVLPDVPLELRNPRDHHQVRSPTASAMEAMVADAEDQGVNLVLASGYRPYATQAQIYQSAGSEGQTLVAPPGTSEHQTGLAADFTSPSGECRLVECFESTEQGKWLSSKAHKYGFILRYPKGKQQITGYSYEPWHFRYLGNDLAQQVHQSGLTFDEYVAQHLR